VLKGVLWIDAVYINQGNTAERNHTVADMGDIYRSASRAICWLGQGTPNTEAFLIGVRIVNFVSDASPIVFCGMKEFLFREYWRRTWIM
jgi:hypothetical protein